jgi:hypothetical protein
MLQQISWTAYFTTVLLLFAGYYLCIGLLYFRSGIGAAVKENLINLPFTFSGKSSMDEPTVTPAEQCENDEILFHALIDELHAFLIQSQKSKCKKDELLYCIKKILRKHAVSNKAFFRESINGLIQVQCENMCGLHLSESDLEMVWK